MVIQGSFSSLHSVIVVMRVSIILSKKLLALGSLHIFIMQLSTGLLIILV